MPPPMPLTPAIPTGTTTSMCGLAVRSALAPPRGVAEDPMGAHHGGRHSRHHRTPRSRERMLGWLSRMEERRLVRTHDHVEGLGTHSAGIRSGGLKLAEYAPIRYANSMADSPCTYCCRIWAMAASPYEGNTTDLTLGCLIAFLVPRSARRLILLKDRRSVPQPTNRWFG